VTYGINLHAISGFPVTYGILVFKTWYMILNSV
jgi:hypothetical protein